MECVNAALEHQTDPHRRKVNGEMEKWRRELGLKCSGWVQKTRLAVDSQIFYAGRGVETKGDPIA